MKRSAIQNEQKIPGTLNNNLKKNSRFCDKIRFVDPHEVSKEDKEGRKIYRVLHLFYHSSDLFLLWVFIINIEQSNPLDLSQSHVHSVEWITSRFRLFLIGFFEHWRLWFSFSILSCLCTLSFSRTLPLLLSLCQFFHAIIFLVYLYVLTTVESIVSPFLPSMSKILSLCDLPIVVLVLLFISRYFLLLVLSLFPCFFLLFFLPYSLYWTLILFSLSFQFFQVFLFY